MKKILCLLLLKAFIISAFANSDHDDIRRKLFSTDPVERELALKKLSRAGIYGFNQELIAMALSEEIPKVRMRAIDVLARTQPMDWSEKQFSIEISNGLEGSAYTRWLMLLTNEISSVVPDEQIKALRSLKDIKDIYPIIQYIVLREIVFKSVDEKVLHEFIRIVIFNSSFQQWLVRIATADSVSDTARTNAKSILIAVKPDLEFQQELLRIAISSSASNIVRTTAMDILIRTRLHQRIQQKLVLMATSKTASNARNIAVVLLKKTDTDRKLAAVAMSLVPDTLAKSIRGDVYFSLNLYPEVQMDLLRVATDHSSTSITRAIATDILLAPVDGYLTGRNAPRILELEVQKELVRMTTSSTVEKEEREYAQRILDHTHILYPEIESNLSFSFKCGRAFRKLFL